MSSIVGIYKITSPSGNVYIGQSRDIEKRIEPYRNLRCSKQLLLYRSLQKYGWENHIFEIAHELPKDVDQSILDRYEQLYMDLYRECGIILLNCKEGGWGGKWTEESKQRMKGRPYHGKNNGKKRTPEMIKRMSEITKSKEMRGSKHPLSKFTEEMVLEIRQKYKEGVSAYRIAIDYKMSKTTAKDIVNRRSWRHI